MDSQLRGMCLLEEIEGDDFLLSVAHQDPIPLNIDFSHVQDPINPITLSTVESFPVGLILPVKAKGDYMGAFFFQQILEGSMVLCRRRLGTLGSCRQRKILSRGVCYSFFYKARYSFFFRVQPPADSDREDLEEKPLIRHSSLKCKGKATPKDGKLLDSAVAGDNEIAAVPSIKKGVGTFASPVGGGKGVSDLGPSEP
ncbi:hypothetical protein ACOSQ2_014406 [Xanthoceras sorbifolium]